MEDDNNLQMLRHEVLESNDHILRRLFSKKERIVLETKHTNMLAVSGLLYNTHQLNFNEHDLYENDLGYIHFYDEFQDRLIFVTSQKVGQSKSFHDDHQIQATFNVIKPNSNHEHTNYMTLQTKKWFVNNFLYVCLQMFDSSGNIALFCHSGRSRSPMYLVAYLILFYDMTVDRAIRYVAKQIHENRGQELDRHCTLNEVIMIIAEKFMISP
jgi:hypothetical protein